jgi:peroxiredoxin
MSAARPDRTALLIVSIAVLAAVAGYGASRLVFGPNQPVEVGVATVTTGDLAPELTLPDLDGQPRRLSEWRGRPVLLNFWATWCTPCIEEMPLLASVRAEQAANGLEIVGIALDDPAQVGAFVRQLGITYPILLDRPGAADSSVMLGNNRGVLPYSVLIGADGRIRASKLGDFDDMAEIRAFLAVPQSP